MASHLLAEAAAGRPRQLVLEGEAGIGKSTLARAVVAEAQRLGWTALWGGGQEDLPIPYLGLAAAFAPLVADGHSPLDFGDPDSVASEVWGRATELLVQATETTAVVLVLDDLQWLDPASQALVLQVLAAVDHRATSHRLRLLTLFTVRTPLSDDRAARTLGRVLREDSTVRLTLTGLDRPGVRDLVAELGPSAPSASLIQGVVDATGGNPMLIRGLVRRGLDDGTLTTVDGRLVAVAGAALALAPHDLDQVVLDRLDRRTDGCRRLLTMAAFLGEGHGVDELADLVDLPVGEAEALIDEAVEADLVRDHPDRVSFAHPYVRSVLLHGLRRREREATHEHIADALEARADPRLAVPIAHHLARAGRRAAPARLAAWSSRAAQHAMAAGAFADAVVAAEHALAAIDAIGTDPEGTWAERADLHRLVADAASHDFDLDVVLRHGTAAIELAQAHEDGERWGQTLLPLCRTLVTNVDPDTRVADPSPLLHDFLRAPRGATPATRAAVLALLAEIEASRGDTDGALGELRRAHELLDDGLDTDAEGLALVLVAEGLAHWSALDLDAARLAYQRAMAVRTTDPANRSGLYAAVRLEMVTLLAGDQQAVRQRMPDVLHRLETGHVWGEHALAAAACASAALAGGHLEEVEGWVDLSERSVRRSGYPEPRGIALPALALARALQGDGTGAIEAIERFAAGSGTALRYQQAIECLLGDVEPVQAAVAQQPWRVPAAHASLRTLPSLVLHAEVAAALGDVAMAAQALPALQDAHQRGVRASQGWVALLSRLIAGCLHAAGDLDETARWLDVAGDEAARHDLVTEAARVALAQATLTAELDGPEAAGAAVDAAVRALDDLGALPLLAAARRVAHGGEGPARRVILFTDLVSSTELNVAAGDVRYLELLQEHDRITRGALRRHGGVEFKHTGDGMAAWFTSAGAAVTCAHEIGLELARATLVHPELPLQVCVGIDVGEPLGHASDLFGLSVVRAARLCARAGPGQVLATAAVADDARRRGATFEALGEAHLKGFPEPVAIFASLKPPPETAAG